MVALEGGAPVREDLLQLAAFQIRSGELPRRVGQTDVIQRRINRRADVA